MQQNIKVKMKHIFPLLLLFLVVLLSGCGNQEIKVSIYDETVHHEKIQKLKEIEAQFGDGPIQLSDIKDSTIRKEYTSLKAYSLRTSRQDNLTGTVNTKEQSLTVLGEVFSYNSDGQEVTFAEGDFPVDVASLAQLVKQGESALRKENSEKRAGLLKIIWLPPILLFYGVFALKEPERTWQLTEGLQYKNVEPSDFGLLSIGCSGVISIIIGIVLIILLLRL